MVFQLPIPTMRFKEDRRTMVLISLYFVLTFILWKFGPTMHCIFFVPLFLATCWWSFIGATVVHNTMHCRMFKERWANKLWQLLLTLTYGHPVSSYVPGHNLSHHMHTQLEDDLMRTSKVRFRWHFLNGLLFQEFANPQPMIAGDVLRSDLRFLRLQIALGRSFAVQCIKEFAWLFTVQIVLFYINPRKFFLYFIIPHLFAQWGIVSMNVLQHDGCDIVPADDTTNPNTARNFVGSWLNFLTMNNGYHAIHHRHPTMHWSKYPDAHERELKGKIHPNLDQANMATYMFRTFVYPGKRVMYTGEPVDMNAPEMQPVPDTDWMDYPDNFDPRSIDFTWKRAFKFARDAAVLVLAKTVGGPLYSPFFKLG